ncbi:glycosyltransferase [Methylotenera versatilis]|uniref:Glycosyl transferase group 1 n=1 Tax=Methylotenera versatilis (strain 301) TaxID=666681 RepID=D7DPA0_METV0|nr:glycosyltransferase [Methylotenera versatilis]ADI29144.1 glycosyl transferase group 1 [Methylotenera versatilis 301]
MHILFFTSEQWPTFRADLTILFGKYLPRFDVTCDLVTEQDTNDLLKPVAWPAGKALLCKVPKNRAGQYLIKFLHQCKVLVTTNYSHYQAVQVRDMTVIALLAIMVCKIKKKPFYYWLSYPQSEGQVQRAKARGVGAGMRYWFPLIQGTIGQYLLYKIILPNAQHVFVQSETMLQMVAQRGIAKEKMTPVPMGVDLQAAQQKLLPSDNPLLVNKRVLVYLGTLDRVRQIEILFNMLAIVRESIPNIMLVLAGDTEDKAHRAWLEQEARSLGVMDSILWTGWLPMQEAWRYVAAAEIGLSPIPRGYLLDMGSPTKAIEYMALGLPVVMNDNPDQALVARESGAATCVPLDAKSFATAITHLLNDTEAKTTMQTKGIEYVNKVRGYGQLAINLSSTYHQLISKLS